MSYKKSNYTRYQIRLREPLEIQTIQPKNYFKWPNELEYTMIYATYMLINYVVSYISFIFMGIKIATKCSDSNILSKSSHHFHRNLVNY